MSVACFTDLTRLSGAGIGEDRIKIAKANGLNVFVLNIVNRFPLVCKLLALFLIIGRSGFDVDKQICLLSVKLFCNGNCRSTRLDT